MTASSPLVETRALTKSFGPLRAVSDVSVCVTAGSVHAFIGANGAGKSTLGRMIAGALRVDGGELLLDGQAVRWATPRDALAAGIVLIAQELSLAPAMSVLDNVYLGAEARRGGLLRRRAMLADFDRLLDSSGFRLDPNAKAGTLSIADQQKVEILRSLARQARLIVMDEPTSSLTGDEIDRLHQLIARLRAGGTSIIYVSHFLDHVLAVADHVTVLRDGKLVRTMPTTGVTEAHLVTAMLGSGTNVEYPERASESGPTVLEVRGVSRGGSVRDVSLEVRQGEIVGVAGLVGSGRSELLRLIFGADRPDQGQIVLDGQDIAKRGTRHCIDIGIAMVPEDRKEQGLILQQSAAVNTTLPHLRGARKGIARYGRVAKRRESREVRDELARLSVKPASPDALVNTMSGGNQQKVLLGRCLFGAPRVLLLDEPTRGIDIGARHALHELIVDYARRGGAVLLVSSDLEEVLGLAHRVLVMRRGQLVADLGADPSMHVVMHTAFGLESTPTTATMEN